MRHQSVAPQHPTHPHRTPPKQVGSGPHRFTYDNVFGGDNGRDPNTLYTSCVAPLVDGLFNGYNATVFAYGQTGSGKTYTMGSAFNDTYSSYRGVIPLAMEAIFSRIADTNANGAQVEFTVRVGFVEIHKEEIHDLLAKRHSRGVKIRELPSGGIVLAGTVEKEVNTKEDMVAFLQEGTKLRATARTGMNERSSRSHAIFTITLEQRKKGVVGGRGGRGSRSKLRTTTTSSDEDEDDDDDIYEEGGEEEEEDYGLDDYLCAKMHLVDLAGSERVKRTKAEGARLQEGININKGLLALGNVINALSEGKPHVPYRDSKLTRMLQDSLGGNSKTVMIACVSPADVNLEESLNTLRYASRARAIKNKPVVNRDPMAAQIASLRQQLGVAKAENAELRKRLGIAATDEVELELLSSGDSEDLRRGLRESEAKVALLQQKLIEARAEAAMLQEQLKTSREKELLFALQRDKVAAALAAAAGEEAAAAALLDAEVPPGEETVERALSNKVHELEDEVRRLRLSRIRGMAATGGGVGGVGSPMSGGGGGEGGDGMASSPYAGMVGDIDDPDLMAEEHLHRAEMARVQSEMDVLERQLESKEAAIAAVSNHSSMQETYEVQLRELAAERDSLAKERAGLLSKLRSLQAVSNEERQRMESRYKQKIKELDARAKGVDKQERKIRDLEAAQKRALESVRALQTDVQHIKEQKAALQRQGMRAAKEYAQWKKERDKEVMHLKKEGRANAAQLMRMEALHAKQLEVLKRKTEEASAARKRLQALEGRRATSSGGGRGGAATRSGGVVLSGSSVAQRTASTFSTVSIGTPTVDSGGADFDGVATAQQQQHQQQSMSMTMSFADEPARREWVEAELDACCSSYELQRVLEGEKALRSEAARQLREVERRLAAVKNPQWWGTTSLGGAELEGAEEMLLKKRARLHAVAEKHGRQIQEVQLALVQTRAREEERGGGAADPSRWMSFGGVNNEVRGVLTTLFRSASQYKSQAYEAQLALTEMSEEVEMLRLKLEVAEAEKLEAAMRAAEAQATAEALVMSHLGGPSASEDDSASQMLQVQVPPPHAAMTSSNDNAESMAGGGQPGGVEGVRDTGGTADADEDGDVKDEVPLSMNDSHDLEAIKALEQLNRLSGGEVVGGVVGVVEDDVPMTPLADGVDVEEEDDDDVWDPSQATPDGDDDDDSIIKSQSRDQQPPAALPMAERAALEHLNASRAAQGGAPVSQLTVPVLQDALKAARGEEWKGGGKQRAELLQEYLAVMGEEAAAQVNYVHVGSIDGGGGNGHDAIAPPLPPPPPQVVASSGSDTDSVKVKKTKKSPFRQLSGLLMRSGSKSEEEKSDPGSSDQKRPGSGGGFRLFSHSSSGTGTSNGGPPAVGVEERIQGGQLKQLNITRTSSTAATAAAAANEVGQQPMSATSTTSNGSSKQSRPFIPV